MSDGDISTFKLAELLRNPDDLDKIAALKSDFTRKKAAVDAQLRLGLKEQLQLTQAGMDSIHDGHRLTNMIKEEMIKIDKLCAEAQNMIRNFPEINAVAQAHRNFTQVEGMKNNIETFNDKLDELQLLLKIDEEQMEMQPNLIQIHYGLSELRNLRDDATAQIKRADDASLQSTLWDYFKRLDDVIDDFDEHMGTTCMQLIPLVTEGNTSLVVRLAIIIEEEEKFDNRIRVLQEAQREFGDLTTKFKSLASGSKEVRGYKDKFLEAIKLYAQGQLDTSNEVFMDDPDKLEKSVRWFFNDLNTVKLGMTNLMPKKWKIFKTYVQIYHQLMHEWLTSKARDPNVAPTHMLAIVHWKEKYYSKMERLGVAATELEPDLLGGGDVDLIREYRQLIVDKVEQWMNQMNKTDQQSFIERRDTALDHDEHGHFRTKTLGDMWRMLHEQLIVASNSNLTDVAEGVTDAMFRALKTRQDLWSSLVTAELERYSRPQVEPEGMQGLQDWLIALANDQIACIDDPDDSLGHLSTFRADYESRVSPDYALAAAAKFDVLKAGLTELGFHCITVFTKLIFAIDFRAVMVEFFTPAWFVKKGLMGQIISTFEDYLGDYADAMPALLRDILVEELSKRLLVAYLGCVRNRGAKFRRADSYNERIRDDVYTVFKFFERFPDSFEAVKGEWRVVQGFIELVECEKHAVPAVFGGFLSTYWDVKLNWVDAVLRTRDDLDWGQFGDGKGIIKAVRSKAAQERPADREMETIMVEVN